MRTFIAIELEEETKAQLAEVQAKAVSYQVETIKRQYAEELAAWGRNWRRRHRNF